MAPSLVHENLSFTSHTLSAKVNTEEEQELAGYFGIRSIPTIVVIRERIGVFQQSGALPRAALDEVLEKVQAIDMAEVHAQVAAEQQAES